MIRSKSPFSSKRLLAFVFGVATALGAQAQSLYSAEVSSGANAILGSTVQPPTAELSQNGATPFQTLTVERDANNTFPAIGGFADGHSSAWSRPEAGSLHLGTVAAAQVTTGGTLATNPNASGSAVATGLFRDVFQFSVPGVAVGTPFSVTAQIDVDVGTMVDGLLTDTGFPSFFSARSSWETLVTMASGQGSILFDEHRGGCDWTSSRGPASCTGGNPGLVEVAFVLYTGGNVVFQMSATATTFAGGALVGTGSASAGSSVDIGHTLAWAGVQSVRDADGKLVDIYSMTGLGSGFDFGRSQVSAVP